MTENCQFVAIVDDESSVRRALTRLFKSVGISSIDYSSGQDFLNREKNLGIGCVILDIHMPGMGGFEVLDSMIEHGSDLPVILVTAHDDESTWENVRLSRRVCFRKPFKGELMLEAVQEILGSATA